MINGMMMIATHRLQAAKWRVKRRGHVLYVMAPGGVLAARVRFGDTGEVLIDRVDPIYETGIRRVLRNMVKAKAEPAPSPKPKAQPRSGRRAKDAFGEDEIGVLDEVLRGLQRGAHPNDLRRLMESEPMRRVAGKVARMKASVERQRELGMRLVEGGRK